jgi:deoxyribonuclease V
MILAIDADYRDSEAVVAGVCFDGWKDENVSHVYRSVVSDIEDYEPGSFYQRELPCILQLLKDHRITPDIIIIDGFVYLGDESRPGLGKHLYNALGRKIPVVGVAKKPFKNTPLETGVLRGQSARPLFVTSAGIDNCAVAIK